MNPNLFEISLLEILLRLFLSVVLGAILGVERERSRKPAGLRTHMLVSLGAAAFTLVTVEVFVSVRSSMEQTRADPIRIVEGIVGGIGFLGAGAIIRARGSVEGITTAAGIWVVGAVGVACGLGLYVIGGLTVFFALVILSLVGMLEGRFFPRP